jgi:uncharacterized phiE125 gp8 family phage protein
MRYGLAASGHDAAEAAREGNMSRFWKLTTAPAAEPITSTQAKAHLNVTTTDDDTLIAELITRARQRVELDTGRAFINQTWTFYADDFDDACQHGNGIIYLPMSPLSTVTTLKYYNTSNVLTTWSATEYQVNTGHEPGRVTTASGYSYPSTYDRLGAVEIAFVAGYGGAGEATCPRAMYDALYLMLGHLYENREAVVTGTIMTTAPVGYYACCAMAAVGWCF